MPINKSLLREGYGLMPNVVLFDKDLKANTKLLYCLISSLCATTGECWSTNKYLAEKLHHNREGRGAMAGTTISKMVSELEIAGYISKKMNVENNSIKNRIITINATIKPKTPKKEKSKVVLLNGASTLCELNKGGIDELSNSYHMNNISKNSISNSTMEEGEISAGPVSSFSEKEKNGILGSSNSKSTPRLGKEKSAAKKEKIDKSKKTVVVKESEKGRRLLENKITPTTKIDEVRLLLYVFTQLTGRRVKVENVWLEKMRKAIDRDKVLYTDYLDFMWRLQHNEFSINKDPKGWRTGWNMDYLIRKGNLDKSDDKEIDQIDTEISRSLRSKLKYLITLPNEFKSAYNASKGVSEKIEQKAPDIITENGSTITF